ncbi:hypothetical protein Tco_1035677, partial [Tanacetum coccineum]
MYQLEDDLGRLHDEFLRIDTRLKCCLSPCGAAGKKEEKRGHMANLEHDPDLAPELAAAAGHDIPSDNRNTCIIDVQNDLAKGTARTRMKLFKESKDYIIIICQSKDLVEKAQAICQKLSKEESGTIRKICKEEENAFILFDPLVIKGLYRRG